MMQINFTCVLQSFEATTYERPSMSLSLYSDPVLAHRHSARHRRKDRVCALHFVIADSIQASIGGRGRVRVSVDVQSACVGARPLSRTNLRKIRHIVLACGIYNKLVREERVGSDIKAQQHGPLRGV